MTTLLPPRLLTAAEPALLDPLADLLIDVVAHGSSVGFLAPLSLDEARHYWQGQFAKLAGGHRLWVLESDAQVIGTVQLDPCGKANGRHRAEVQKLIVHSRARGQGLARQLMDALEAEARADRRSTLVLDTEVGSPAETVYQRFGWTKAGEIPAFAADTAGALQATALYYKRLA